MVPQVSGGPHLHPFLRSLHSELCSNLLVVSTRLSLVLTSWSLISVPDCSLRRTKEARCTKGVLWRHALDQHYLEKLATIRTGLGAPFPSFAQHSICCQNVTFSLRAIRCVISSVSLTISLVTWKPVRK